MEKEKIEETPAATNESADDFFSAKDLDNDLKGFLKHMKTPVEKIDTPPSLNKEEEPEPKTSSTEEPLSPEDEEMASHLDYTEEHRLTAEFILIQMDKGIAFSLSMVSGMDSDRYRRRKVRNQADDYEVEIAAALVKKYQMRLSLEWMLATAILMGYAPMVNKAIGDRRAKAMGKMPKQEKEG